MTDQERREERWENIMKICVEEEGCQTPLKKVPVGENL